MAKINEGFNLKNDPYKLISGLNRLSIAMNSNFEGTTDEVSKLLHKIRYIIPVVWTFIGDNFIKVLDFDQGYCDEIMSATVADFKTRDQSVDIIYQMEQLNLSTNENRNKYKEYVDKLSINYLDPSYQINETFPIRIDRIIRPNEFKQSTTNEQQRAGLIYLRDVMSWTNQYNMYMHNVQTKAKDFFFSIPLIIKKHAEVFQGNTAYTAKSDVIETGKFRYFKDGEDVVSLLYNISESEKGSYNTLNDVIGEGNAKRKGIKLKNIYKFTKPDVGDTEEARARSTAEFIKEVKIFQRDVLSKNYQEGMTIRGNQSNLDNIALCLQDLSVELSMYYKDIRNPQYVNVPIFGEQYANKTIYMNKVFSDEAIKADEALDENKLGLKNVWGVIYDNGGSMSESTFWLNNDKTDTFFSGESIKTKTIDKTVYPVVYEYYDIDLRPVVNPFRNLVLLMWKD